MPYTDDDVSSARGTLGTLWPSLRAGLWHSTEPVRYSSILEGGAIRPDGGEGGNVYKCSFAASVAAVSLFDFEKASEDDALGFFKQWNSHLWRPWGNEDLTVWIRLNRDLLPGRLILARDVGELALAAGKNCYPRVEACHIGPIPAGAFDGVLAISKTHPFEFETITMVDAGLQRLKELTHQWRKPPDENDLLIERLRAARTGANIRLCASNRE